MSPVDGQWLRMHGDRRLEVPCGILSSLHLASIFASVRLDLRDYADFIINFIFDLYSGLHNDARNFRIKHKGKGRI